MKKPRSVFELVQELRPPELQKKKEIPILEPKYKRQRVEDFESKHIFGEDIALHRIF